MSQKNKRLIILKIVLLLIVFIFTIGHGQPVEEIRGDNPNEKYKGETLNGAFSETFSLFSVVDMKLSIKPSYGEISGYNFPIEEGVYPGIMILNLVWGYANSTITCFNILTQEISSYQNTTLGSCLIFVGLLVIETDFGESNYTLAGGAFYVSISPV